MSENVYGAQISSWYDRIMAAGYNLHDHQTAATTIRNILGFRSKVLELGIGTGLLAEQLVKLGLDISGFDFSPSMLEVARVRLGDRVKLYQQDVVELDLPETYHAAVSRGGVWVSIKEGNCLDSHITDYKRNLSALSRVAQHLIPNGFLIIGIGPEQKDLTIDLGDGVQYSQRVLFKGNQFEKEYFITRDDQVLASQQCRYQRFREEEMLKLMGEAGFYSAREDASGTFVIFEKNNG